MSDPHLRVLVVASCPHTAHGLTYLLRLWGYPAHAVADGPGALDAARSFQPNVVLLALPGGEEVGRAIRRQQARPVLLVGLTEDGAGFDAAVTRRNSQQLRLLLASASVGVYNR